MSYDPLQKAINEGPALERKWLRSDEKLTNTQKAGFIAISTVFGLIGCIFLVATLNAFRDGDLAIIPFGLVSLFFLYFGLRGLWRVTKDVFWSGGEKHE